MASRPVMSPAGPLSHPSQVAIGLAARPTHVVRSSRTSAELGFGDAAPCRILVSDPARGGQQSAAPPSPSHSSRRLEHELRRVAPYTAVSSSSSVFPPTRVTVPSSVTISGFTSVSTPSRRSAPMVEHLGPTEIPSPTSSSRPVVTAGTPSQLTTATSRAAVVLATAAARGSRPQGTTWSSMPSATVPVADTEVQNGFRGRVISEGAIRYSGRRPGSDAGAGPGASAAASAGAGGRVEFFSKTHGRWIGTKVIAADPKTGAIQIDKKPGIWLDLEEQRERVRPVGSSDHERKSSLTPQRAHVQAQPCPQEGNVTHPTGLRARDVAAGASVRVRTYSPMAAHARHSQVAGQGYPPNGFGRDANVGCQGYPSSEFGRDANMGFQGYQPSEFGRDVDMRGQVPVPSPAKAVVPSSASDSVPQSTSSPVQPSRRTAAQMPVNAADPRRDPGIAGAFATASGRLRQELAGVCGGAGSRPSSFQPPVSVSSGNFMPQASAAARQAETAPSTTTGAAFPIRRRLPSTSPSSGSAVAPECSPATSASAAAAAAAGAASAAAAAAAAGARAATSAPVDGTIARPMMASPAAAGTPLPNAETASVKSARSSRAAPAKPAARETEVPGDPEQPREKVREIIKYRCPVCSEIVDTVEEALAHCSQGGGSCGSSAPAPAPNGPSQDGADPAAGNFAGGTRETVAMDGQGRPSIARQVNSETGEACTIVWNEDGSQLIFGEEVVQELLKKSSKNAEVFLRDLTSHQLRGLVHEMGQRLLQNSQLYHHRLEELKALGDKLNYMYFGLTPGASEKDLDNAYRKLAKKMHPDKNGGTEEAKIRFQHMKERYEALKKRREGDPSAGSSSAPRRDNEEDEGGEKEEQGGGAKSDGDSGDDAAANGKQGDREDADRASGQVGHQLEDGDTPGGGGGDGRKDGNGTNGNGTPRKGNKSKEQEDSRSIHYDPHDRDSMQRTAAKMLEQLQTIEVQMETLTKEWKRARAQYPT
eukprot:TRINITY_DN40913_c0_g2_i1.p1 TRINITY_DN40913_c0_g2~~TRINITY_DN40913_c0_g2_i1.p1  ORF type:complete len:990 (+),score=176.35 TRINITY_DN40913_c0_g2_i1:130-3099(+)